MLFCFYCFVLAFLPLPLLRTSGWLKAVFTVSDAFVLRSAGLDALVSRLWQQCRRGRQN
jgi:hypothetical protein